jgi:hypothetical protein
MGFGVQNIERYVTVCNHEPSQAGHPIYNGPFTPVSLDYTGNGCALANLAGTGTQTVLSMNLAILC